MFMWTELIAIGFKNNEIDVEFKTKTNDMIIRNAWNAYNIFV